jgi:hypothetical protein
MSFASECARLRRLYGRPPNITIRITGGLPGAQASPSTIRIKGFIVAGGLPVLPGVGDVIMPGDTSSASSRSAQPERAEDVAPARAELVAESAAREPAEAAMEDKVG